MRKLCHHKLKKLFGIIQLDGVEQGFDPNQTDFTSSQICLSCCDINSLDLNFKKNKMRPLEKCSIGTAGNSDTCGMMLICVSPVV